MIYMTINTNTPETDLAEKNQPTLKQSREALFLHKNAIVSYSLMDRVNKTEIYGADFGERHALHSLSAIQLLHRAAFCIVTFRDIDILKGILEVANKFGSQVVDIPLSGRTLTMLACSHENSRALKLLIKTFKADFNYINASGDSAGLIAKYSHVDFLRHYLEYTQKGNH